MRVINGAVTPLLGKAKNIMLFRLMFISKSC
jgi:hypothetical protein